MKYAIFETKIGKITIVEEENKIIKIDLLEKHYPFSQEKNSPIIQNAYKEITEFISGTRKNFTFPYYLDVSSFQKAVLDVTSQIPYGETISYQEVAKRIGKPKACRAVGGALGHNPLPFVIPCHRVIGKNNQLTGFTGGLDKKSYLLELEKKNKKTFLS